VDAAVAVFELVRANVLGDDPILFRVNGVATLHHGRFSREDRAIMDSAVDSVLILRFPRAVVGSVHVRNLLARQVRGCDPR
jgi:CRISPR-associated endonuclease/helicase Cas3